MHEPADREKSSIAYASLAAGRRRTFFEFLANFPNKFGHSDNEILGSKSSFAFQQQTCFVCSRKSANKPIFATKIEISSFA